MVFWFAHADVLVSFDKVYQFLYLVPIEDQFVVAYPHYQLIDFVNFDECVTIVFYKFHQNFSFTRSAASRLTLSTTFAYIIVVLRSLWPSILLTVVMSVPAVSWLVAKE